jgi:hypothetical protein
MLNLNLKNNLIKLIDAKLKNNNDLKKAKLRSINCQLCFMA